MEEEVEEDNVNVDLLDRQKMKNHMSSPNEEEGEIISSPGVHRRDREHRLLPKRPNDGQSSSLTVVGIPHVLNTMGKLSDHFSKFGDVVNIEVLQSQKKAVIKYNSHMEALKAIKSPEAVMGNRFIKVFWTSNDHEIAEVKKIEAEKQKSQEEVNKFKEDKKKQKIEATKEAKRIHEELIQKRLSLIKEKQAMVSKLLEKCKKPNIAPQKSVLIMDQVNTILQSIKSDLDFINSQKKVKKTSPIPS